ncbi:MAG: hypothetical protein ACKPA9_01955, partial [Microcystis sp.]
WVSPWTRCASQLCERWMSLARVNLRFDQIEMHPNYPYSSSFHTKTGRAIYFTYDRTKGFCPQCRGELRSPKRYIIKAQVPYVACGAGFRVGGANKAMIN